MEEGSGTRNHVIEGSLEGRQERGFTAHAVKKQVTTQLRNVAPSGASVEVTQELTDALMEVRQDTSDVSWMLAGFEDNNLKRPLALVAKGTGDISELRDSFLDDQVMYALYRTSDCIDDIKTVKFVYIYWCVYFAPLGMLMLTVLTDCKILLGCVLKSPLISIIFAKLHLLSM